MSLFTDNIIPGEHGKVFGTDAEENTHLNEIKNNLLKIDGISEVVLNTEVFPREFTVYTDKVISVAEIEKNVKSIGFHAIPKEVI